MLENYLPIVVLLVVAVGMAGAFTLLATWLGPRRPTPEKLLPYESGLDQIQSPKIKLSVRFYRIALLFLVFDIEAAFFYPWAVLFRDLSRPSVTKMPPYFGMMVMAVFLAILLLALVFVWRKRALEWD